MLPVVILALCAVLLLILFMVMPGQSSTQQRAPFWGVNHAHRGLHTQDKRIPENSLAAFCAAANHGYGIELDLQLSKDERVVVFHDDELKRVCGVDGRLRDYTFEQLRELRLHGAEQQIPLFEEVLQAVGGRVPLVVELKSSGMRNRQLCRLTLDILSGYNGPFCIESFDPRIVRWFKKHAPQILRGQLAAPPRSLGNGIVGWVVGNGLTGFWSRPHFIAYQKGHRPLPIRFAHRFAMNVVWTVRPKDDIGAIEMACDAVIFEFYEPPPRYMQDAKVPDDAMDSEADITAV